MKKLFIILALLSSLPAFSATYYISKSLGDNTRTSVQAQSKATPWASAPGMPSCNNACASYGVQGGDNFILYGGDTWTPSDMGWNFSYSGTHTLGVDATWFNGAVCGGTFCAPIFDCQFDTTCGLNIQALFGKHAMLAVWKNNAADNNVTVDTFEFKGVKIPSFTGSIPVSSAPGQYDTASVYVQGGTAAHPSNVTVEGPYCHGWSHATQAENNGPTYGGMYCVYGNISNGGSTNNTNVILSPTTLKRPQCDGSDESPTPDMGWCWGGGVRTLDSAYMYKVANEIDAAHNTMTNNEILSVVAHYSNPNITSQAGHCDMVQHVSGVNSSTVVFAYNYISDDSGCSGTTIVGINQTAGTSAGNNAYIHDNVITNVSSNQIAIITGGHANIGATLLCTYGTFWIYNNTVYRSGGSGSLLGNGEASTAGNCGANVPRMTDHYANNHFINSSGALGLCDSSGATCTSDGGNLQWSTATATSNGYTAAQTFPFSPTLLASPTVAGGVTQATLNGAGYNTSIPSTDSTVGGTRSPNTRPTSGPWDVGAYNFSTVPWFLTLVGTGNGNGTIKEPSNGSNISAISTAGVMTGSTQASYADGTSVTIAAVATSGTFIGWQDATCASFGTGNCTFAMHSSPTVTALFALVPTNTLACSPCNVQLGTSVTLTSVITNMESPAQIGDVVEITDPNGDTVVNNAGVQMICQSPTVCNGTLNGGSSPSLTFTPTISGIYTVQAQSGSLQSTPATVSINVSCSYGGRAAGAIGH